MFDGPIYSGTLEVLRTQMVWRYCLNDIESFEVLKDGAATAIYGSRHL
jgi:hypothetical protein